MNVKNIMNKTMAIATIEENKCSAAQTGFKSALSSMVKCWQGDVFWHAH